jgi:hypothetical protein
MTVALYPACVSVRRRHGTVGGVALVHADHRGADL